MNTGLYIFSKLCNICIKSCSIISADDIILHIKKHCVYHIIAHFVNSRAVSCYIKLSFAFFTGKIKKKEAVIVITVAVAVGIIEIVCIFLCSFTIKRCNGNKCDFHFILFGKSIEFIDKFFFFCISQKVCIVNNKGQSSFNLYKLCCCFCDCGSCCFCRSIHNGSICIKNTFYSIVICNYTVIICITCIVCIPDCIFFC